MRPLLEILGIGSERLRLEWISASQRAKIAAVVEEFAETVGQLSPNPFSKQPSVGQLVQGIKQIER